MTTAALAVVQQWHNALNTLQEDKLIALVHDQVEIGGPRGSARGAQSVRRRVDHANVRLLPQRWFGHADQIVVEELGEWLSPATGQVTGSLMVATLFRVDDSGLITRILRHDVLEAALEDACLTLEDEIKTE